MNKSAIKKINSIFTVYLEQLTGRWCTFALEWTMFFSANNIDRCRTTALSINFQFSNDYHSEDVKMKVFADFWQRFTALSAENYNYDYGGNLANSYR